MAKSSSGFSCHLLKTFDGCTDQQTAEALTQAFAFVDEQMNVTSNEATARSETDVLILQPGHVDGHPSTDTEGFADAAMDLSCIFVFEFALITLAMQIHL